MILSELLQEGMVIRHWSDQAVMLRQVETGDLYADAVDVMPCRFTYEETSEPIPDAELDAETALDIIMGEWKA